MGAYKAAVRNYVRGNDDLLTESVWPLTHPLAGHCYTASEAYFHLNGGYDVFDVYWTKVEVPEPGPDGETVEFTHWFLRRKDSGAVVDLTSEQFESEGIDIPYVKAQRAGFLTSEPSERAQEVIRNVKEVKSLDEMERPSDELIEYLKEIHNE